MTDFKRESNNSLRFSWHLADFLAGSAMPGHYGDLDLHLQQLRREGIKVIICLAQSPLVLPKRYQWDFSIIHVPIVDGEPPTREQMDYILDLVSETTDLGLACLVHCRGGVGRSGTVLTALLMRLKGYELEQALEIVGNAGRKPSTPQQIDFLKTWMAGEK